MTSFARLMNSFRRTKSSSWWTSHWSVYPKEIYIFLNGLVCLRAVTARWHQGSRDASDRIRQPLSPICCFQRRSLYGSEPLRVPAAISLRHVGIRWVRINAVASDRRERSRRPIDGVLAPRDQSDAVHTVSGFERCRSGSRFEERPKRVIGESIPVVRVCNRAGLLDLVQMLVERGLDERLCLSLQNRLWTAEQHTQNVLFRPYQHVLKCRAVEEFGKQ
ncbi:MAG: hypothetical protein J07HQW1_01346 [Haloquadratum walsbyi J07HQW1]|uniref:Uncharacterized protein n=1 Tax=Haloquadratum walsbyi J07HQW1 TaxID=1238424 RepID=U1PCK7_9EURY|nr:MAG: hypothetical protein J07HQW1_01346 [Haloquadratum walsbyi J07HQW1]